MGCAGSSAIAPGEMAGIDATPKLLARLGNFLEEVALFEASIGRYLELLRTKCQGGVANGTTGCDVVLTALAAVQGRGLASARSRWLHLDEKVLAEHLEEADTNIKLLEGVAALCTAALAGRAPLFCDSFRLSLDRLAIDFVVASHSPGCFVSAQTHLQFISESAAPMSILRLLRYDLDARDGGLRGGGLTRFVRNSEAAAGHGAQPLLNYFSIVPRSVLEGFMDYISEADIEVRIKPHTVVGEAAVAAACIITVLPLTRAAFPKGVFDCAYSISGATVSELDVDVRVCHVRVGHSVVPAWDGRLRGKYLYSLDIQGEWTVGLAVTPDERYLVVSYSSQHILKVFKMHPDDGAASGLLRLHDRVGGYGSDALQFRTPCKMCLAPNGNLLICDNGNNRVQELTAPGEVPTAAVRSLAVTGAWSIAMHGDVIAVGSSLRQFFLISFTTGTAMRNIPYRSITNHCCDGMRFTADGRFIVFTEFLGTKAWMLNVTTEEKRGLGTNSKFSDGNKDVEIALNGDIILADGENSRICVFSADGGTHLRDFRRIPLRASLLGLSNPSTLARAGNRLFGLSVRAGKVYVFE